ncbi:3'-5' exonuclease [Novosphingobium sp. 11B]
MRQLPAAAQGLNAVRLVTIHGSKGLEFDCVHLPGLNGDTLPGPAKAPQCVPPDGVIAAVSGDVREHCALAMPRRGNDFSTWRHRELAIIYSFMRRTRGASSNSVKLQRNWCRVSGPCAPPM